MKVWPLAWVVLLGLPFYSLADTPYNYTPPKGYVPDAATACAIAEAIWLPIYGKKQIASEHPFKAHLKDGIWTVEGANNLPTGDFGGVALIEISKETGKILRVSHGM